YVQGLVAKVQGAYDYNNQETKTWSSPYEIMGRARDQVSGDYTYMNTVPGITKTSLRQGFSASYRTTFQSSLNYARTFGEDHGVSVLALYEHSRTKGNRFATGASNFPLTIIHEIGYGSTAPEDVIAASGASDAETARAGFVTRLNYAYRNKYLVELVSRWDASANFAEHNRWESFPAVGLGWIVSEENFFSDYTGTMDFFKLKASVGKTGNDRAQVGTFPYMATFSQNSDPVVVIGGQPVKALYTNALQNPDLRWETSTISNVGIETRFLDGKFGFDFEWFYKYTEGILGSVSNLYPPSVGGYYPALANIGTFDNRGFDAQVRYKELFGDFRIGLTGNINWARNRYLKLDEASGISTNRSLIGKSVGTKIGYEVEGMIQTWEEARNTPSPSSGFMAPGFFKFRDRNGDGRINVEDMTYIGRSNVPELTFGLNVDLAYKGFDFSALLQGATLADVTLGGTYEGSGGASGIDDNSPFTRTFYNYGNAPYFLVENSWRPDNLDAEFPRITAYKGTQMSAHNANRNSAWVRKGDYLRLKAVQLGYTLPRTVVQSMKIENIRLFAAGSNLFTWDHLKYLDPEMPNVNNGFYPQQRIYEFGLSVTF
ncbi:MAG TPA: SusC/RagA family TonB-linked outer membrane protein, partial [Sphingobacterium sp.]|nr:SusC/RagA family TonB-linked outer membrane protein [Sphingobacterium sp.]